MTLSAAQAGLRVFDHRFGFGRAGAIRAMGLCGGPGAPWCRERGHQKDYRG
jgi:hypothetical protein